MAAWVSQKWPPAGENPPSDHVLVSPRPPAASGELAVDRAMAACVSTSTECRCRMEMNVCARVGRPVHGLNIHRLLLSRPRPRQPSKLPPRPGLKERPGAGRRSSDIPPKPRPKGGAHSPPACGSKLLSWPSGRRPQRHPRRRSFLDINDYMLLTWKTDEVVAKREKASL
jgi:hypothetical protein